MCLSLAAGGESISHPPLGPRREEATRRVFCEAPFVNDLGCRLTDLGSGWLESALDIVPRHCQHHGFIHAGVQATMADHTAGGAATTLLADGGAVLTAEFKINLLRPAKGTVLTCRAEVLKPGSGLVIAESEVFTWDGGTRSLVAKAMVTLAVVPRPDEA